MGIADTIKGWFSSSKNTASAGTGNVGNTMQSGMDKAKDTIEPQMGKVNDGIDSAGKKIDDMTGGKASGTIDKGTDAAKDAMNKMGKQNP